MASKVKSEVYCICRKPDNGKVMVGCDGCGDWFHCRCVNLKEAEVAAIKTFTCPDCLAKQEGRSEVEYLTESRVILLARIEDFEHKLENSRLEEESLHKENTKLSKKIDKLELQIEVYKGIENSLAEKDVEINRLKREHRRDKLNIKRGEKSLNKRKLHELEVQNNVLRRIRKGLLEDNRQINQQFNDLVDEIKELQPPPKIRKVTDFPRRATHSKKKHKWRLKVPLDSPSSISEEGDVVAAKTFFFLLGLALLSIVGVMCWFIEWEKAYTQVTTVMFPHYVFLREQLTPLWVEIYNRSLYVNEVFWRNVNQLDINFLK